jgi:hypothetical protein
VVQNLSALPPLTLPFTAFAGPSLVPHAALPVAALFRARLPPAPELLLELDEELDDDDDDEELDDELEEEEEELELDDPPPLIKMPIIRPWSVTGTN